MAKLMIIVSCLVFGFSCFTITPSTCSSNDTDLLALLAFKAAIDMDPQGVFNSWNETTHYCKWEGIFCDYMHHPDRVVGINLNSQGLVGSLSPHIGNLSFLTSIVLINNSFHGQIPQEIGFLRQLEFVEFSNNSFVGSIPRNLSQCPNLFYLNLIDNKLWGNIPPELGSLYKLKSLGLSKNKLQGHIPPSLGNLTALTKLSLAYCDLKGEIPESLSQLQNLKFLQLSENLLVGAIPSGLFNISTLGTFGVSNNTLEGAIPATIGLTLPNLIYLYLNENRFSGKLPSSLSNATTLRSIILSANYFTGPMPKELGKLTALQAFIITYNLIQDDIGFITSLKNCTQLQYLSVGINPLTGSLPESISNLSSNLKSLEIYRTQVDGIIPLGIENLGSSLIFLSLESNFLEGPIPFGIHKLFKLEHLFLKSNRFTNEIPSSLGNLTLLNNLDLSGNDFYGSIPPSLSNCTNLISLNLSHNSLNGSIPREMMSLSSLSVFLDLSYNSFTGSIPSEVGLLKNLGSLDFSNNRLSGLIPGSLGSCMSLQRLHLESNSLQGEIPSVLSSLKGLQILDLSRNNLSGPFPAFLENLDLEYLNLSFNRLQGEVPTRGLFRNGTAISVDGNNELCGGVFELNLLPCSSSVSSSKKKRSSKLLKILIPMLVCGGTSLTLSICFIIYIYMRKMHKRDLSSLVPSYSGPEFTRLSYSDLLKATGGFSEANLLGSGRFGSVYKGILDYGNTLVAVKVLNLFTKGASKSFMAECDILKGIRHRNLLKIISICESIDFRGNDFKALVYEFHANGSLEKWLYHNNRKQEGERGVESKTLNIIQRLNIAIDIARGLEYLHFGTDSTIVHGDLKPDNILLDRDMNAHIGDFGLAKIISSMIPANERNNSSIGIKGTLGYVAPEYGTSDLISAQGDVYSYGILLLEMFTNKRPTDDAFKDDINLHNFVSNVLQAAGCVTDIVDPLVLVGHGTVSKINDCLTSILGIGVSCSREVGKDRMVMNDVVHELEKIKDNFLAEE